MQIHVGRDNQKLGVFSAKQILDGLAAGQFRPTDIAWHEGLGEWQPLHSLAVLAVEPAPVTALTSAPVDAAAPGPKFALPVIEQPKQKASRQKPWLIRLAVVAVAAVIGALVVPVTKTVEDFSIQRRSADHARQILAACKLYAGGHDGSYPPDLAELVKTGMITDDVLRCPVLKDDTQPGYRYFGAGLKTSDPPDKVVLIGIAADGSGRRIVGKNDGSLTRVAVPVVPVPR